MKIAIVDDIAKERHLLHKHLEELLDTRTVPAEFCEYESGEQFLAAAAKEHFQIVFLDIYMNGIDGIKTAEHFRLLDPDCLLIFTTTSTEHALEGFRVRAMHYLVKPYRLEDLEALIEEILKRMPDIDRFLTLKVHGSMLRLSFEEILLAEHFSHSIQIETVSGKLLTTRQSFHEFTKPLKEDPRFFICSRGVIINMQHAADFHETTFVMNNGKKVFVSRDLVKTARQTFMEFLFRKGPAR